MNNQVRIKELETELRNRSLAKELFTMKEENTRFRATLKERFSQDNGCMWVRYFRNYFNYESVFRAIKKSTTEDELYHILLKRRGA